MGVPIVCSNEVDVDESDRGDVDRDYMTICFIMRYMLAGIGELCSCMQNPAVLLCYTDNASKPSIMGDDSHLLSDNLMLI